MSETPALELRGLSVRLGRREVLKRVSLTARFGEVTAILGPNGAGKSSLLRAVAGVIPGYARDVAADRLDAATFMYKQLAR